VAIESPLASVVAPLHGLGAISGRGNATHSTGRLGLWLDHEEQGRVARRMLEELQEAESHRNLARATHLREELDFVEHELHAALGLGSRARTSPDPVERARKSVYNRIRAVIDRNEARHWPLAKQLRHSIRTGTFCSYQPERPSRWLVRI
jgi:hypothetical protein